MNIEIKPFEKQAQLWRLLVDNLTMFVLYGGGAGGGKSWAYCEWLLTVAYAYPGSRGFIGRNELKRIMNSTFVTFKKVCAFHHIPKGDWKLDGKYNVIIFKNGSTIDLLDVAYSPKDADYERFGSTEYSHGFGEEAGEWHFKAFDVLKSRIGRHKIFDQNGQDITPPAKFGLSCNPSKGWVYRIFYKPWKLNTLPEGYQYIPALYTDNPYTSKDYGKQLDMIDDPAMRARLRDGNWDYGDGEGELMKYDSIVDMFTNSLTEYDSRDMYISADIARHGSDRSIINVWQGLKSIKRYKYTKTDTDYMEEEIKRLAMEWRVPFSHIVIDEDGIGGGVLDHLKGTKGFIAVSPPIITRRALRRQNIPNARNGLIERVNFAGLKHQCGYKLAELVESHSIAIQQNKEDNDTDEITAEISLIKKPKMKEGHKDDGKLRIASKDEMKEALGHSPDYADTFLMRMVFELLKDRTGKDEYEVAKERGSGYYPAQSPTSSSRVGGTLAY